MKTLLISCIILYSVTSAQQLVVKTNGQTKNVGSPSSEISVSSIDNSIVIAESQTEPVRLIVELKAPSRIEQKLSGRLFSKVSASRAKQILAADNATQIEREFETIINGFAVTTKRENISIISAMPDVKAVYPDAIVKSFPLSSSSSSPIVPQSSTSVATGKGIRIGIIDTGIDYLHEAFGKGFGVGHVVAGGYDFINNDSDPLDDNGHGTHVAGIISGNSSTISGAAKDAQLFIYKALDQSGNGSTSSVLAAIEQAIKDSVKILNLSLGTSSGSSDDPLSTAVNRAVQSGIVVVVAAGNSGEFSSINSPGVAEYALTVGATDHNSIASFSSKGPETDNYRIKPEIVAPGVNILSAKLGGGYVQMSGTSMATPFVTALAAALCELHPDWSAIQIKDALISNSVDLGNTVFSQGHGRINENVLKSTSFSTPAQISFGFNPPSEPSWKQQRSITIYNKSSVAKNYQLSSASSNPALQIRCTPQRIEVAPNGYVDVTVEVETNNLFLTNNGAFENGYSGIVNAFGNSDSITIPYVFFKGPILQLRFNEIPWLVMIHNKSNFSKTLSPKTNTISMIVKDGTYDVVTSFYGSLYVVKEDITVNGKAAVDIASSDAKYPISFKPINEKGEQLNLAAIKGTYGYMEAIVHQSTGFAIVGIGGGSTNAYSIKTKYFSSMSSKYSYGYSVTLQPNNRSSYTYDVIVDSGVTAARTFVFQDGDMKHVDVKYQLDANVQRVFPITWTTFIGKYSTIGGTFYDGNSEPLRSPFLQNAFYTQRTKQFPMFHQREAFSF